MNNENEEFEIEVSEGTAMITTIHSILKEYLLIRRDIDGGDSENIISLG